jgi:hypothetical protein
MRKTKLKTKNKNNDNEKNKRQKNIHSKIKDEDTQPQEEINESPTNYSIEKYNINKISMNLVGYLFSFFNLEELFVFKNLNKKIRNGILTNTKGFKKFINLKKYFFHSHLNFYQFLAKEVDILNSFYNKCLEQEISVGEVDHIMSEFLISKFDSVHEYNLEFFNDLELKFFSLLTFSNKCPIKKLNISITNPNEYKHNIIKEILIKNKSITYLVIKLSKLHMIDYSVIFNSLVDNKSLKKLELVYNYEVDKPSPSYIHKNYESLFSSLMKNKSIENFSGFITEEVQQESSLYQCLKNCFTHNKIITKLSLVAIFTKQQKLDFDFLNDNSTIKSLRLEGSYSFTSLSKLLSLDNKETKNKIDSLKLETNYNWLEIEKNRVIIFDELSDDEVNEYFSSSDEGDYYFDYYSDSDEDSSENSILYGGTNPNDHVFTKVTKVSSEDSIAFNSMLGNCRLRKLKIVNCNVWRDITPDAFKGSKLRRLVLVDSRLLLTSEFLTSLKEANSLESIFLRFVTYGWSMNYTNLQEMALSVVEGNKNLREFDFIFHSSETEEKVKSILKERRIKALDEIN